jgi:hypothetical protein
VRARQPRDRSDLDFSQVIAHTELMKSVTIESKSRRTRPKVGTPTSAAVSYAPDAFAPLDDEAVKDWGL